MFVSSQSQSQWGSAAPPCEEAGGDADLPAVVGILAGAGVGGARVDLPRVGPRRGGGGCGGRGLLVQAAGRVPRPRGGHHTGALRLLPLRGEAARPHPRQAHDTENMGKSYVSLLFGPCCRGNGR